MMGNDLKLRGKYALEHLLQNLLQGMRIFPLRQKVVFSSFSGRQYSDSPRRISEYLARVHPEIRQVWAFCSPEDFAYLKDQGIKTVRYKSLAYLYEVMTARVYVDNVEFWSILKFRPEQMVLQTWHGGGAYKRIGQDRLDVGQREQRHAVEKMNKITLFLSSSQAFTDFVIRGAFEYQGRVLPCGLPRNDELRIPNALRADRVRRELGIGPEEHILLYAPTFRNSHSLEPYSVDFAGLCDALHRRFGGSWRVVLRMHYYISQRMADQAGSVRAVDASSYPDMQHLLNAADVLLTDYSSSIWDFLLTGKPCFLYATDLDEYQGERNFYVPIDQWPFPLAQDNGQLQANVEQFDEEAYRRKLEEHYTQLGGCESGSATAQAVQAIADHISGGTHE